MPSTSLVLSSVCACKCAPDNTLWKRAMVVTPFLSHLLGNVEINEVLRNVALVTSELSLVPLFLGAQNLQWRNGINVSPETGKSNQDSCRNLECLVRIKENGTYSLLPPMVQQG